MPAMYYQQQSRQQLVTQLQQSANSLEVCLVGSLLGELSTSKTHVATFENLPTPYFSFLVGIQRVISGKDVKLAE